MSLLEESIMTQSSLWPLAAHNNVTHLISLSVTITRHCEEAKPTRQSRKLKETGLLRYARNNVNKILYRTCISALASFAIYALSASAAYAQTVETLPEITITANRVPFLTSNVGSTVEVVTRFELEQQGAVFVRDYLETLPGISLSQSGPAGTQSDIFVRGAPSRYLVVLVDGIEISDPSAPQNAPNISRIPISDVEEY
jgi:outer membrane receptor for Fe3+-dicitrate